MSCPYTEEELERWEDVANPMGPPCSSCYDCECIHWQNCPDDCDAEDRQNRNCRKWEYFPDPYDAAPCGESK